MEASLQLQTRQSGYSMHPERGKATRNNRLVGVIRSVYYLVWGLVWAILLAVCMCEAADLGSVWFSFFLTNFSENLAMGRIWLCTESEYH
jgi:hypothetical protein